VIIPLIAMLGALRMAPAADDLHDLPLVHLPMPTSETVPYFAVVLSGDGGWASLDKQIAEELVSEGVRVVGLNCQRYFWTEKTPDQAGSDLGRIIRHYQREWGMQQVVLIGYSRGADALPLMLNRMPAALLDDVRLTALLGLAHATDLVFHSVDLVTSSAGQPLYPLAPEIQRLQGRPLLCIYGSREKDTLCPDLQAGLVDAVERNGGHHFDGDYRGLARLILGKAR